MLTGRSRYVGTYQKSLLMNEVGLLAQQVRRNLLQNEKHGKEISSRLSESDIARFLRARKGNVNETLKMLHNWYIFRTSPIVPGGNLTPDNCLDNADPYEDIYRELLPHSNCGHDLKGRPCYFEKTGIISCRFREVINREGMSSNRLIERHVQQQEMMVRRIDYANKIRDKSSNPEEISKQVVVFDLKNLSFALDFEAIEVFRRTIQIDQDYYPERLQYFFMLNTPIFFSAIWTLIKPFVDDVTVNKFKILGSDFQQTLFEYVDPSVIPKELGGTNEKFQWVFPGNLPECNDLGIQSGERQIIQGEMKLTDNAENAHYIQAEDSILNDAKRNRKRFGRIFNFSC